MKKIIIAILLVFSCGIFALTIPKPVSAHTNIENENYAIELSYFDDDTYEMSINFQNTLVFENSHTKQMLYLDTLDIILYCYLEDPVIDGRPLGEEYLFYSIQNIDLEFSYKNSGTVTDTFWFSIFPEEQGGQYIGNTLISANDFEEATRDVTYLLAPHLLNSTLFFESDSQLIHINFDIWATYHTGQNGDAVNYYGELDLLGDFGIDFLLPSSRYLLGINNIVPLNVQSYKMRYDILTYNREHGTTINKPVYVTDGNFLDFIQDATTGFLETELFGTVSIADILLFIVSIALLIFLLRFFAGG